MAGPTLRRDSLIQGVDSGPHRSMHVLPPASFHSSVIPTFDGEQVVQPITWFPLEKPFCMKHVYFGRRVRVRDLSAIDG